jgi:hypothetical protein
MSLRLQWKLTDKGKTVHRQSSLLHAYCCCMRTHSPSDYPFDHIRQWGAGGGSATHKEPIQAPSADSTETHCVKHGRHQPTLVPCQPMYVLPAHFDLPKVDLLTKSTAIQALNALLRAQGLSHHSMKSPVAPLIYTHPSSSTALLMH